MNAKQRNKVKKIGRLLSKQNPDRQGVFCDYLQGEGEMEYKERVMSVEEVADFLGLKKLTVYELLTKGKIKAKKTYPTGGKWLILESSVIEYLKDFKDEKQGKDRKKA